MISMNCNLPLTSDFKSDVESLPERFLFSDEVNRKEFEKFFARWGHCVVTKAFGGEDDLGHLF